jgi:AcrR family transcriptional regulator
LVAVAILVPARFLCRASFDKNMQPSSRIALTREQLYRRVWSKPLSLVAGEVGLSGNALAKICNRLLVPYPSRGYWAKVSGGKSPDRPPLPPAPEVQARRVTISSQRAASRRTRTRLKPAERREQLIEVAKEIIVKEGLHAASMKRIAAEAGISETLAYNYFATRDELFIALASGENAKIQAAQRADISQFKDHYERVIASTRTYLRQIDRRSGLLQMLLRNPEVRAGLREENRKQGKTSRNLYAQHLAEKYGVPRQVALGCTVVLSRLCGRAAKVISARKIALAPAERMCIAMVVRGSQSVIGAYSNAPRRSQGLQAA